MGIFERYAPFVQDFIYQQRLGSAAGHSGRGGRRHLQHRRERAALRLDRVGQDGGGLLPHPHPVFGGPAELGGRHLHRPAEGAHQRPVCAAERPLRRGGHPRLALARRRGAVAQGQAAQKPLRHPANHARVARSAATAQAYGPRASVRRPALHRHRRGTRADARRPRRADALSDRTAVQAGGRQSAAYRSVGDHRRPGGYGALPRGRDRAGHRDSQAREQGRALAAVDGAFLHYRPASGRGRRSGGRHAAGSRSADRRYARAGRPGDGLHLRAHAREEVLDFRQLARGMRGCDDDAAAILRIPNTSPTDS